MITYGDITKCKHCKGKGTYWYDGTHSMYNDSEWTKCPLCEGSGKVQKVTITSSYLQAYKENDNEEGEVW